MNRSECLKILGLHSHASEHEIRKQYKKLAMKLHPDTNPDPKAHESFIQLTNAVTFLLNPKSEPDKPNRKSERNSEDELLQRMKAAKERYEKQRKQQQVEEHLYYLSLTTGKKWFRYKIVAFTSLILSISIILDSFLPNHYETDTLLKFSTSQNNGIIYDKIAAIELKNHGYLYVENLPYAWINAYRQVQLETSWLLHTPRNLITYDDFSIYKIGVDFHLGSLEYIFAFLLLIPMIPYFYKRKSIQYVFLYHFSFWFIGIISLYILLTDNRLFHLITLGFL